MNPIAKRKLKIEERIVFEAEQRKACYRKGKQLTHITLRKRLHFLIAVILKADQKISREKIVVISDKQTAVNGPVIYACTHIGGNDIQRTFQIIRKHAYLMLGDPGILYQMPIYQALRLNGVIPLETKDREDRKIAYNRAIELLRKGGNLLIYPEGAWNVSPNLTVMKLFTGTVRIAKETSAAIVPIAVEQYGNTFYFNIGETYFIPKDTTTSIETLNNDLQERLATLKWDIMKRQEIICRGNVPDDYLHKFQNEIVERCNYGYGFSLEDALSESFHDKNVTEPKEAFAFLTNLTIDKNTAFLAKIKGTAP